MSVPTARELAAATLAQQHPATADWVGRERRLQLLADEHDLDVRMATDLEFATARRDRFAPEFPVRIFLNCWVRITDDLSVMLSMRYEGGDPERPFVDASALTRALTADDRDLVSRAALRRFGDLRPRYLRWWSREPAGHFDGTLQDKRFLAAPLSRLTGLPELPSPITLAAADDLADYQTAVRAYAAVDHEHPVHPEQATIEPYDDLEELLRDGTLFDVRIDSRWCGYVGVERGHKLGLDGFKIAELILTPEARGHGYGRYLTSLLARALVARGAAADNVIIGTIHHDNLGARWAAERAGRIDIGGWVRLPL